VMSWNLSCIPPGRSRPNGVAGRRQRGRPGRAALGSHALPLAVLFAHRAERQLQRNCVVSPHPFADEGCSLEVLSV
jgi:hypothetical protein